MKTNKPFCQNCANNQRPILEKLGDVLAPGSTVLEIGSGTGQHAVYFGTARPDLIWYTSDLPENHGGIQRWLNEAGLDNVRPPVTLDVSAAHWPAVAADAVYSANTAHIMSWAQVTAMFRGAGESLRAGGVFILYGPFSYGGVHTSDGNAQFDRVLRRDNPASGLRDFDALAALAATTGFGTADDHAMPANNRLLVWRRA